MDVEDARARAVALAVNWDCEATFLSTSPSSANLRSSGSISSKSSLSIQRSLVYVNCSSGTYVRSLAEDIAKVSGTFATVTALKRIGFGDFNKKLISLDYLLSLVHSDELISVIKPLNLVFKNANEIILDENTIQHILNGRSIKMNHKK